MKYMLITLLLLFSISSFAQEAKKTIIDLDINKLSEEEIDDILNDASQEGWVLVRFIGGNDYVCNFSNKDYTLFFSNCIAPLYNPQFLIEYSNNYGDGDYGGIDFRSSTDDDYAKFNFVVDGIDCQNPFKNPKGNEFKEFLEILKKSDSLTIDVYNRNTAEELELERSICFKLQNGDLLDSLINCN